MHAFDARPPPLMTSQDGTVRIAGTRVSLETVVFAFDSGATAEEIVQQYPTLDLAAVYAVIAYVLDHRSEVDQYVAGRRDEARAVRHRIEAQMPARGLRERLLARRRAAGNE
ncbi:MAG: DUF433 domain-containing protein [Polyangiaceae bacterium]|nr:DUF433 domain-containing protein [Polyangiaceae bacterium]